MQHMHKMCALASRHAPIPEASLVVLGSSGHDSPRYSLTTSATISLSVLMRVVMHFPIALIAFVVEFKLNVDIDS